MMSFIFEALPDEREGRVHGEVGVRDKFQVELKGLGLDESLAIKSSRLNQLAQNGDQDPPGRDFEVLQPADFRLLPQLAGDAFRGFLVGLGTGLRRRLREE